MHFTCVEDLICEAFGDKKRPIYLSNLPFNPSILFNKHKIPNLINFTDKDFLFIEDIFNKFCYNGNVGLTKKQKSKIIYMITSIKKQLFENGITFDEKTLVFKSHTLESKHNRSLTLEETDTGHEVLRLYFDYKVDAVELVKTYVKQKDYVGIGEWNPVARCWELSATVANLVFCVGVANMLKLKISDEILDAYKKVEDMENIDFSICLKQDNGDFFLENAEDSLINYLKENNITSEESLVWNSGNFSYTIDEKISAKYKTAEIKCATSNVDNLQTLLTYGELKTAIDFSLKMIRPDQKIIICSKTISANVKSKLSVDYFNKISYNSYSEKTPILLYVGDRPDIFYHHEITSESIGALISTSGMNIRDMTIYSVNPAYFRFTGNNGDDYYDILRKKLPAKVIHLKTGALI